MIRYIIPCFTYLLTYLGNIISDIFRRTELPPENRRIRLCALRKPLPDRPKIKQESPAIADKPARRESLPKLLPFDVPTTLSLTILAYLHAFNCYCVRNPRNPQKFNENANLWSSRSSKVIDIGVNRKPICNLLLVINSNFSCICYRFRDIHG